MGSLLQVMPTCTVHCAINLHYCVLMVANSPQQKHKTPVSVMLPKSDFISFCFLLLNYVLTEFPANGHHIRYMLLHVRAAPVLLSLNILIHFVLFFQS